MATMTPLLLIKEIKQNEESLEDVVVNSPPHAHAREATASTASSFVEADSEPSVTGSNARPVSKQFSARAKASSQTPAHGQAAGPAASRLPPDYRPSGKQLDWATGAARQHGVALNAQLLSQKFTLYYSRGAGKEHSTDDWDAKWERWVFDEIGAIQEASKRSGGRRGLATGSVRGGGEGPIATAHAPPAHQPKPGKPVLIDTEKLKREYEEKQNGGHAGSDLHGHRNGGGAG